MAFRKLKILIVTAWYYPLIHPRAHRWTALAEYWAGEGHDVHIVCSRRREYPQEALHGGVQVHRVGFSALMEVIYYYFGSKNARGRVGAPVSFPGRLTRLANWLYNSIWKKIYFPDDACIWYLPAKNRVLQLLEKERFDALITVSLPFTGQMIGLEVKRRYPQLFWLADIGDPFSIQGQSLNNRFFYGNKSRRLERQVLESANAVTVTTEFTLRAYYQCFGKMAVAAMHAIPPLLHPAPGDQPSRDTPKSPSHLQIGYFGALYAPTRTPDAFLDLLRRMFERNPELRERVEVHFYGEIFPEFFAKMNAEPALRLHGLCSREEVRDAMQTMDILLNIGNKSDFQLPSKAVEYMATGLPVVHLSYTEDDPFIAFFDRYPLLLRLQVKDNKVGEEGLEQWLALLEGEKKMMEMPDRTGLMEPYLIETIAGRYLDLLRC